MVGSFMSALRRDGLTCGVQKLEVELLIELGEVAFGCDHKR
jgi:hypothetical protein